MNLVLTIAMGEAHRIMGGLTHPSIRAYADRIGADFMVITEQKISATTPHWEKFQIYELLNKYERIIYLDTDIIVRDDCPNLFNEVPVRFLGAFDESRFTDRSKELMIDICKCYGMTLPKWNGRYYNTGVMVISRHHKPLFKKPELEVCNFYEQSYLNMMIAKEDVPIHLLEHKFNRMTCMDRFTGEERFASYIIHYAGVPDVRLVLQLIPRDLEKWRQDGGNYNYKHHIYVSVSGGYGDQIAAEPAVRFMREQLYPDADFVVATHWPRLYRHLEREMGVMVCKQGEADLRPDTPYFICQSLPGPDKLQWALVSHILCHTLDYASIALMKRTLPIANRRIKFELEDKDFKNLEEVIPDCDGAVIVHAGKHWNSKTFPIAWWQDVIDGLIAKGEKVILVGKDDAGDHPYYIAGARGMVELNTSGCIDLRNLLDLGALAALLSKCKTLVSNDSFPIHLAGAFDCKIVLIPSCKHPDHILPWRNGSIYWNALALYKRLVLEDINSLPTNVYETSAEVENIDWSLYLPEPKEVIEAV